jgi:hypothetical protein
MRAVGHQIPVALWSTAGPWQRGGVASEELNAKMASSAGAENQKIPAAWRNVPQQERSRFKWKPIDLESIHQRSTIAH